jgi:tripartite-type tricarboxylate transporter receptor subunit TctC
VPTAAEAGFPALSLFGGHCLYAPKEMPEALQERIATDVRAITTNADVARRLRAIGYIPRSDSPQELAAILERERKRWTEVAQKYGAKPTP